MVNVNVKKDDFSPDWRKLFEDVEAISKTVSSIREEQTKEKQEREQLKIELEEMKSRNQDLEKRVVELERYSRKGNVIISGIPKTNNENVRELALEMASQLGVELLPNQICAAHRLPGSRQAKTTNIIVRLNDFEKKAELIKQAKKKRLEIESVPIFIRDHLLPHDAILLREAKRLNREGAIRFVWIRNGEVMIRKNENTPAIKIRGMDDLTRLVKGIVAVPQNREVEEEDDDTLDTDKASSNSISKRKLPSPNVMNTVKKPGWNRQSSLDEYRSPNLNRSGKINNNSVNVTNSKSKTSPKKLSKMSS